jgi:CheY-like chemotaxis protein
MSMGQLEGALLQPSRSATERNKPAVMHTRDSNVKSRGLRILVVEDEAIIALELEAMLEDLGHEVLAIARTEAEAVRLSRSKRPELVLMDVRLGRGGDGINAAHAILEKTPTCIVFCSAYARDPSTQARMEEIKPAAILSKPILPSDLKQVLDRLSVRD